MQNGGGGDENNQNRGKEKKGDETHHDENPIPFNKIRYKMAKLNYQQEEDDDEKEPPFTSPDVVLSNPIQISVNGSSSNSNASKSEPTMKKLTIPTAPQDSNTLSPTSGPTTSVVNFGPFTPSGSSSGKSSESNYSILRIRVLGSTQPEPATEPESESMRRLLAPNRSTYLRPVRPGRRPDPNTRMGPPEARRICKTPYETVKSALTFLKSELGLTAFHPTETSKDALFKITPYSVMSIEEVILELDEYVNSIPKTSSSDEMKESLMVFQRRLGMPEWPGFYNLIWVSAMEFLEYLSDYFLFDGLDEEDDDDSTE